MAGHAYANSTGPVPEILADALARFPEEVNEIKAEMDIRRQIAALANQRSFFGVGM